jgi:hypothetical protein
LKDAVEVLTTAYQGIAEFAIWLGVVVLPILLPPTLLLWALWKLFAKRTKVASGD